MAQTTTYALGYSKEEERRLAAQAGYFADLTEDVFRRAGLRAGMRVLDVGCGVGDVAFLAARLVGPGGSVLGVDRAPPSIETARQRAAALGLANVAFAAADLETFEPPGPFDAVIGRFVLLYLRDPAALLRRCRNWIRPGGLFAFQEMDMSHAAQVPPSELFEQTGRLIMTAFSVAGAQLDMGSQLLAAFRRADLPWPQMSAASRVEGGPESTCHQMFADVLRSLLPVLAQHGLIADAAVEIDTLADRLRMDAVAHQRLTFTPRLVGAWVQLPDG